MLPIKKDVYVEARFPRATGWREVLTYVLVAIMVLLLFWLSLMLSPMLGNFAFVAYGILAFVVIYAGKFLKKQQVEYEYIFTNGDLDIDKIIAKEDRKRRYSVNVSEMEFFEEYKDPAKYERMKFDRIAFPCSSAKSSGLYCFAFRERTYGRCLIVINMTDELLTVIRDALPRYMK